LSFSLYLGYHQNKRTGRRRRRRRKRKDKNLSKKIFVEE
jgi:hypothetical protein